jgi:hypothetical protein
MALKREVLPAPFGPRIAILSPTLTFRDTLFTALNEPNSTQRLVTSRINCSIKFS